MNEATDKCNEKRLIGNNTEVNQRQSISVVRLKSGNVERLLCRSSIKCQNFAFLSRIKPHEIFKHQENYSNSGCGVLLRALKAFVPLLNGKMNYSWTDAGEFQLCCSSSSSFFFHFNAQPKALLGKFRFLKNYWNFFRIALLFSRMSFAMKKILIACELNFSFLSSQKASGWKSLWNLCAWARISPQNDEWDT
jgi:hypothetical protein